MDTRPCQANGEYGGPKKLGVCIVMELCEMGDLTAYLKVRALANRYALKNTCARARVMAIADHGTPWIALRVFRVLVLPASNPFRFTFDLAVRLMNDPDSRV